MNRRRALLALVAVALLLSMLVPLGENTSGIAAACTGGAVVASFVVPSGTLPTNASLFFESNHPVIPEKAFAIEGATGSSIAGTFKQLVWDHYVTPAVYRFTPSQPFPAGSKVTVKVLQPGSVRDATVEIGAGADSKKPSGTLSVVWDAGPILSGLFGTKPPAVAHISSNLSDDSGFAWALVEIGGVKVVVFQSGDTRLRVRARDAHTSCDSTIGDNVSTGTAEIFDAAGNSGGTVQLKI
jgi:hypothetical protein